MSFAVKRTLAQVHATLRPVLDIIDQRVHDAQIPRWCATRGWSEFLLALSEQELARCEAEGFAVIAPELAALPESLSELAQSVRALSLLPRLEGSGLELEAGEFRGVNPRKRSQLSSLLGALSPLAGPARRIVDVGAGSGHFTRLSARHFDREALGLERNAERVAQANSRARADAGQGGHGVARFTVIDAIREPLELRSDDLAIGLHACGELGDTLVRVVAESGADLALVSCCLQKISGSERLALSRAGQGFALRKDTLGLSNLSSQAVGVEASIEHTMLARQARYALRLLLRARGLDIPPGAEMRGINRRQAHAGLAAIAQHSLARRDLAAASSDELAQHERDAALHFHTMRRVSLPRDMLARVIELAVVLDRAACLEESGHTVRVATLFDRAVTPRNISLFASRHSQRLPRVQGAGS
jgi:SAM-dependent methyltransferase